MNSGVYAITHTATGKVYVGSALRFDRRWIKHKTELDAGIHHSQKLQRAWDKYGREAFEFKVLLVCGKDMLLTYEQTILDFYDSARTGYNMTATAGSRLGMKSSELHKARMSAALKGRVMSPETRAKISAAQMGKKRGTYSPEHRAAIAASKVGKPRSEETRAKLSAANMGKVCLEITKAAVSLTHKGKPKSPESIAKRTATRAAKRAAQLQQE